MQMGVASVVSIHALLAECDAGAAASAGLLSGFNPRTPCGVRLFSDTLPGAGVPVSIHALLAECDNLSFFFRNCKRKKFQSTHSLRSATVHPLSGPSKPMFQSTHSLRSATAQGQKNYRRSAVSIHALLAECDKKICNDCKLEKGAVSIHALLAECDLALFLMNCKRKSFNPRTPCGVRRLRYDKIYTVTEFQSTHSLRSATAYSTVRTGRVKKFQSTHSLRSATFFGDDSGGFFDVSIHALLAECDFFLSQGFPPFDVSIHALLAECDKYFRYSKHIAPGFNPRTPCGVRPILIFLLQFVKKFQSTHSLRSATEYPPGLLRRHPVSIHALLAECDRECCRRLEPVNWVSIHALLAECDCAQPYTLLLNKANHTLRQPP